ncbi:unnamed protein product [Acanthoscelides obtectus]|uniref:Uncharacterized protein n=1 Tax=Acanthoscelides obtectus TaxID=200917 RepID=A0A9P0MKJ3_ACAOB|nr:unnamed protein product [Acanthoscelides obtectus]CAK1623372.1 hypothetical protein AOBTE_LOCUS1961 [Acanthoscelides obtectus]
MDGGWRRRTRIVVINMWFLMGDGRRGNYWEWLNGFDWIRCLFKNIVAKCCLLNVYKCYRVEEA